MPQPGAFVQKLRFDHADKRLALVSTGADSLVVLDLATGTIIQRSKRFDSYAQQLVFGPTDRFLAVPGSNHESVFDLAGDLSAPAWQLDQRISSISFVLGALLIIGDGETATAYAPADGTLLPADPSSSLHGSILSADAGGELSHPLILRRQ